MKALKYIIGNIKSNNVLQLFLYLVGFALIFSIFSPGFLKTSNLLLLLKQSSFLGIVCLGQAIVMIAGGIDLSVSVIITISNGF